MPDKLVCTRCGRSTGNDPTMACLSCGAQLVSWHEALIALRERIAELEAELEPYRKKAADERSADRWSDAY
jgi:predicted  nucleic acid-binding Zn-ribbon protein